MTFIVKFSRRANGSYVQNVLVKAGNIHVSRAVSWRESLNSYFQQVSRQVNSMLSKQEDAKQPLEKASRRAETKRSRGQAQGQGRKADAFTGVLMK